jgi:hypothetical protein
MLCALQVFIAARRVLRDDPDGNRFSSFPCRKPPNKQDFALASVATLRVLALIILTPN